MSEETMEALREAYAGKTAADVEADLLASRHAATIGDVKLVAAYIAQIANE